MDNPFRDWVEDSTAFGQAACAAYTRAWQAIEAIASGEPDAPDHRDAAERALRALVTDLNTIDGIHGSIDTDRREHVWAVVCDLAARAHIPRSQASAWFDQDRRF